MHAYAHHWACQICYGPRFLLGAGLTDGEAIERLWSMLRIFIGPTRSSGVRAHVSLFIIPLEVTHSFVQALRRLWLLDRGLAYILSNLLSGVGDWINKRLTKAIQKREQQAKELLKDCELSHSELRKQWDHQCKVQSVVKQRMFRIAFFIFSLLNLRIIFRHSCGVQARSKHPCFSAQ